MKICPNCQSKVDDNFDLCWNCQFSFSENRIVQTDEFSEICPQCGIKVDLTDEFCSSCHFELAIKSSADKINNQYGDREFSCFRCMIPMLFKGNTDFNGNFYFKPHILNQFFNTRENFDLYFCPKCGKIELFIPLDHMRKED
jgi:Zn finger protein HypA/HybF involved in hydrogenase expression